ncbi:MAG: 50S ribosomal protein L21 [Alphaproteobacteria bacterium 43-37]|nr:MAG: 50S ribosomal protein L21 [Alphaproteobacteria bacterium 43-37]
MFAVLKTGGKQYRVSENQIVIVEKILGDEGSTYTFDNVLMLEDGSQVTVGKPMVAGAKVVASIVEQTKGDKIIIFKKTRRHTYRRKNGHRQPLTVLRIEQIAKPGESIKPVTPRVAIKPAKAAAVEANVETAEKKPLKAAVQSAVAEKKTTEKAVEAKKPAVRGNAKKDDSKGEKPAPKGKK